MRAACVECGAVTDGEGSPRCGYRSFRLTRVFYCEACWTNHHRRSPAVIAFIVIITLVLVASVILAARQHWTHVVWTLVNVALLWAFMYVSVVPHELGHALAALLLGWRVVKISLGEGRPVARWNLLGLRFELKAAPLSGHVSMAPRRLRFPRLEYWLITAAGPTANLAILLVVLQFTPLGTRGLISVGPMPLAMLAAANLCVLVGCLVPYYTQIEEGGQRLTTTSDGLALFMIPFWSKAHVADGYAGYLTVESLELIRRGAFNEAKALCMDATEICPNAAGVRIALAYALTSLNDHTRARSEYMTILQHDDLSPELRLLTLNNIAWVNLQLGGPELLDEANRYSQEALSNEPGTAPYQGTRGSLLIERGQIDEGLVLVQKAFEGNVEPQLRALNACYLALGEALRGNIDKGIEHLAVARRLDDKCVLLSKMEARVAQLRDSTQGVADPAAVADHVARPCL